MFHVDAFTDKAFGGNPAGVVPEADGLTTVEMQQIARELNLSETAFLFKDEAGDRADFRIRYFTPSSEIDFCGHATLGSAWLMATEYDWLSEGREDLKLHTNIGVVPIEYSLENGHVKSAMMAQITPEVKATELSIEEVAELIGVQPSEIDTRYSIKLGYTGNWHLFVPIKTYEAVDLARPNIEKLKRHNIENNIVTTHLFTFDRKVEDCLIYTRDFAPAVGISEDPVTGSANGALAGYLVLEDIIDFESVNAFRIAQGHSVGRPGFLDIKIDTNTNGELTVKVGGQAVVTIAGMIKA